MSQLHLRLQGTGLRYSLDMVSQMEVQAEDDTHVAGLKDRQIGDAVRKV